MVYDLKLDDNFAENETNKNIATARGRKVGEIHKENPNFEI